MCSALTKPDGMMPFAAFVCTEPGAALARDVIASSGAPSGALLGGGLSGAARAAPNAMGAKMLLTELDVPVDQACRNVSALRKGGTNVIVFGQDPSIHTYRALRDAGALEYFPMPVSAEEILGFEIVTPDAANLSRPVGHSHRAIGVIGTNGGVGASAFAASLAHLASMSGPSGAKTALVDADMQFGSISLDLDREGTPGLRDALSGPDRIDRTFLDVTMDHLSDTLSLYSYADVLQQSDPVAPVGWSTVMQHVTQEFSTTFVDLPRSLVVQTPDLLTGLDAAILVVPAGYAGVNAAVRLVGFLQSEAPNLSLCLVLSEVRKDAQLSSKDIAKALGLDLVAVLPRCDAQMLRAQRKARTAVELYPRAPYAKACKAVLDQLAPVKDADHPSPSLMRRIFG